MTEFLGIVLFSSDQKFGFMLEALCCRIGYMVLMLARRCKS